MSTHKPGSLIFTICLAMVFFFLFPAESQAATTIYVGKSDADYICDGKDDHVQINAALKKAAGLNGATVYLKGPFTYNICDTLYIGDNTTLTGDKSAVLKLGNGQKWAQYQSMIQQMNKSGNNKNITICGFEMDGNRSGNTQYTYGKGYHNFIFLINSSNIDVHDMYFHDNLGDGLRIKLGGNVKFYNNKVERLGHDGLFCIDMNNVEAYNNRITTSANSGLRIVDSNHVRFHDNVINAQGNGGPGIQLEAQGDNRVNDVQVYNNVLQSTYGPGIWMIRITNAHGNDKSYACNVRIAANVFNNCGTNTGIDWAGGIVINGWDQTVIEDNVFDGCNGAAISHRHPAKNKDGQAITPPGTGYTTIVRNNTIKNTKAHKKAGAGIGIHNYVSTNIFRVANNTMSNNPGGDIVGKNAINDPVDSIPKFKASPLPKYTPVSSSGSYSSILPNTTYTIPKATTNVLSFIGKNTSKLSDSISKKTSSNSQSSNYKVSTPNLSALTLSRGTQKEIRKYIFTPNLSALTLSPSAYKPASITSLGNVAAVKTKLNKVTTDTKSSTTVNRSNGTSIQSALYTSFNLPKTISSSNTKITITRKSGG